MRPTVIGMVLLMGTSLANLTETIILYPGCTLRVWRWISYEGKVTSYSLLPGSTFEKITGEDFTSITGLPLLKLIKFMRNFGFTFEYNNL